MGVLRIRFGVDDICNTRIAAGPDPAWEIVTSLHRLQTGDGRHRYADWHTRVRHDIERDRLAPALREVLIPLMPRAAYFPDFLTPPQTREPGEGIERILETPPRRMRSELGQLAAAPGDRAWVDDLAAGRPAAVRRLGVVLHRWFEAALAPQWAAIDAAVSAERALRAAKFLTGGLGAMLGDLGPTTSWSSPVLSIGGYPQDRELDLGGRGITLVPSYFLWQTSITLADPDLPPVLVYPALRDPEPPAEPGHDLAPLLGGTRLSVLRLTESGATTGELARRAGISPATASHHTSVLRSAGLIASRRHGNLMLHSLTELGRRLLAAK